MNDEEKQQCTWPTAEHDEHSQSTTHGEHNMAFTMRRLIKLSKSAHMLDETKNLRRGNMQA